LILVQFRLNSGLTLYLTNKNCAMRISLIIFPPKSRKSVMRVKAKKRNSRIAFV
jgi:hypothetical protein